MKKFLWILVIFCSFLVTTPSHADLEIIRFGVMYFYPPFVWNDSLGKTYGLDASIAEAICIQTQKKCQFVPMPFYKLFSALDNNEIDAIISAVEVTTERKAKYDFTMPYFKSTMSFITTKSENVNIPLFINKKIGTLKGTVFYNYLKNKFPKSQLFLYDIPEDAIDALTKQQIDYVILDTPTAKWWVNHGAGQLILLSTTSLPDGGSYAIAVKKGNTAMLNILNNSLQTLINNGKIQQIIKLFFI